MRGDRDIENDTCEVPLLIWQWDRRHTQVWSEQQENIAGTRQELLHMRQQFFLNTQDWYYDPAYY